MMKKGVLILFGICLCLLSACGVEPTVSGKVIEANMDEQLGVVSFVVRTDDDKEIGFLLTDETSFLSFVDGVTAGEFRTESPVNCVVSVEHQTRPHSLTTQSNQKITAYTAKAIHITGFLTSETATLSDGTKVDIWQYSDDSVYVLQNGTELLRTHDSSVPDHIVDENASFDNLDKLSEAAQSNILKFYKNQGRLYDVQTELEKAYDGYLKAENPSKFDLYVVSQDISPTASNERMMYFLTSVMFPVRDQFYDEYRTGAAFDRKTGQAIDNRDLFSCSPEEAIQKLLEIAGVTDPILKKEVEAAFQWEYIVFFPTGLEVSFPRGTLPSMENTYILGLDYEDKLRQILHPWAIPENSAQ